MSAAIIIAPSSLAELADAANRAHREFESAKEASRNMLTLSLERAIAVGEALIAAKIQLKIEIGPSGRWLPWLKENFDGSEDMADRYMRLAKRRDELSEKTARVRDLSQREALRLIADPQKIDPALGGAAPSGADYDSDSWFTPPIYIAAARAVMHGIDLDPASCAKANETVRAERFYSREDDGLTKEWRGSIWLNPPYSQPLCSQFVAKLIAEHSAGCVSQAIVLLNASTDTGWFHDLAARASLCLTRGRISFLRDDGSEGDANRVGQVFFYIGPDDDRFAKVFSRHGLVGRLGAA